MIIGYLKHKVVSGMKDMFLWGTREFHNGYIRDHSEHLSMLQGPSRTQEGVGHRQWSHQRRHEDPSVSCQSHGWLCQ